MDDIASKLALVEVQENGVIRLASNGTMIGRLNDSFDYEEITTLRANALTAERIAQLEEALNGQVRGEMGDGSPCSCDARLFEGEGLPEPKHGKSCTLLRTALKKEPV